MSKLRTSAIAAAAVVIVVQVGVLAVRYGTATASLWGDYIDAITPLIAAVMCWLASREAGPFGRRVWRLVSLSALLSFIGQSLYTYNYDYLHAPLGTLWPSDFLVFFWIVPAMMTLFLSARDSNSGLRWLRACDFVQVCTLVLAVELSQIYVPSRWQASGQSMQLRAFYAGVLFYGLLALSFLVRGLLSDNRTEKAFFLRVGGFLVLHGIVLNVTLKAQASGHYQQGTWIDFLWTSSYCVLILLPGFWNEHEDPPGLQPRSNRLELLALFSPLLIPAIVFPLVLSIAQEQFYWSIALVLVSFVAASGRLFVVQKQLLISSREVEKNLALLRGITEGTTDAIFVKDLSGRYLMINEAPGPEFWAARSTRFWGKDDSQLFDPEVGAAIMQRDREVVQSGSTQNLRRIRDRRWSDQALLGNERSISRSQRAGHRAAWHLPRHYGPGNAPKSRNPPVAAETPDSPGAHAPRRGGVGYGFPRGRLELLGGTHLWIFPIRRRSGSTPALLFRHSIANT